MLRVFVDWVVSLFNTKKEERVVPSGPPTKISERGLAIIKEHEGLRLKAYLPTKNDVWTIGWGHTHTARKGMTITEKQAQELLESDVRWVEEALRKHVKAPLNQNQFDALGSFVFNVGQTNFSGSTLLRKLNQANYLGAADEFPKWKYQKGVVLQGLVKRRAQERELFVS